MTRNAIAALVLLALALGLAGCGQKGDLYRPGAERAAASQGAAGTIA